METKTAPDLVRSYFFAYEAKNREALETLLTEDFTFSSPLNDNIGRQDYFERCWPNCENHRGFHIEHCFSEGNEAIVTYTCERTDGARFRNTESFLTDGRRIKHVDVYFGPDTGAAVAETEVRTVIDATVKAIRAKDAAALMVCYHPDVLAFDLILPLQYSGAETVQTRASEWLSSFEGRLEYDLRDLRVLASDAVAFAHSLNHVRGTRPGGDVIDMWWRATLCFRKFDDEWLVAHAHNSVPFDMTTGQASLSLNP